MIHPRIVDDTSELQELVPAWRRLLARASNAQPVLTPLWLLTWWGQFGGGDGRMLRVIAAEEDGELVGLVPLLLRTCTHRRVIPVRRVELLATGEDEADEIGSDYVGGLALVDRHDEVARATADAFVDGALGEWDELRMPAMSGDDPLVLALRQAFRGQGIAAEVTATGQSPFIPLPGTWDEYLGSLGSSRRYTVSRTLRELEKWAGKRGWALRHAVTEADLREGRRVLEDLHTRRWQSAGRTGVFASTRFAGFHDEVMPRLLAGEDGASLDLSWLVVKGEPVAASYSIRFGRKVHFYQSGRSMDVPKSFSPGIAIHALAIQRAIADGLCEYDFLAGASRYKRDLALDSRPIVTLRAVAPGLRSRTVEAARLLAEGAIARARAVRGVRRPVERAGEPAP